MKLSTIILFLSFISTIYAQEGYNCYTIAVGKKISSTGRVILAHNEDDFGNKIINIYRTQTKTTSDYYTLTNGKKIPFTKRHNGFLKIETTQEKFGDFYVNDYGVAICSNACPSREDTAQGILDYDLRRLIAIKAKNARNGVKILGKLIEKYGYNSSGRTYTIADSSEAWIVAVVQGKHWIAQRVADTQVAIVPNYYTISYIDLKDTNNFLGSKDIIKYAIKRGWYNPKEKFNFRKAYSDPNNLCALVNTARNWIGIKLLKKNIRYSNNLPGFFTPDSIINLQKLKQILSNHYEGTDFEANKKIRPNPHKSMIHPICNIGTKFSTITDLNGKNTIIYFSPFNPCVNPYIPISLKIKKIPKQYQKYSEEISLKHHFDKKENEFETNKNHAYAVFYQYNKVINKNYWKKAKTAKKKKSDFEKQTLKQFQKSDNKSDISTQILIELYKFEKRK